MECQIKEFPQSIENLRKLTEELEWKGIVRQAQTDEINTDNGTAFIIGMLKNKKIAVADNYASAGCKFPHHHHDAHEIFIVYDGEMELYVEGKLIRVRAGEKPYYFDARQEHWAEFKKESRYIAITIPADKDWPEGR